MRISNFSNFIFRLSVVVFTLIGLQLVATADVKKYGYKDIDGEI